MFKKIKNKLQHIKYYEEKKRFLLFSVGLVMTLFLLFSLLKGTFASYTSNSRLVTNVDKAIYLIDEGVMTFNIDSSRIVPSDTPYTYTFTVNNFDDTRSSEINILYTLRLVTTTNLPLSYALYRNGNTTTNLLSGARSVQDSDGAWYNIYAVSGQYEMPYSSSVTDTYTFIVNFPSIYSGSTTYANNIENIEIDVLSEQKIS